MFVKYMDVNIEFFFGNDIKSVNNSVPEKCQFCQFY